MEVDFAMQSLLQEGGFKHIDHSGHPTSSSVHGPISIVVENHIPLVDEVEHRTRVEEQEER